MRCWWADSINIGCGDADFRSPDLFAYGCQAACCVWRGHDIRHDIFQIGRLSTNSFRFDVSPLSC
jgi:hypothetical protein